MVAIEAKGGSTDASRGSAPPRFFFFFHTLTRRKERKVPPWAKKPHRIPGDDEEGSGKNKGEKAGREKGWEGRGG